MPKIGLCLTNNISLSDWQKVGHFSRKNIYEFVFKNKYKYSIISYGGDEDKSIEFDLDKSIKIIPLYKQIKKLVINTLIIFSIFLGFLKIMKILEI